ncbi:MAG: hypothetical protein WA885_05600 [Phormidesmis sp.]
MTDSVMKIFFTVIASLVVGIRPLLPAICCVIAWAVVAMLILNLSAAVRDSITNARKMHSIPCARCRYASRDYRLKCSVHPLEAFSEQAIGCQDFQSTEASVEAHSQLSSPVTAVTELHTERAF